VGRVLVEKLVTTSHCPLVGAWEFGQDISRFKKRFYGCREALTGTLRILHEEDIHVAWGRGVEM